MRCILVCWQLLLLIVLWMDAGTDAADAPSRIVVTFREYNACSLWQALQQQLSLDSGSDGALLLCASMSKCYGRRLVLSMEGCLNSAAADAGRRRLLQEQQLQLDNSSSSSIGPASSSWVYEHFDAASVVAIEEDTLVHGLQEEALVTAQLLQSETNETTTYFDSSGGAAAAAVEAAAQDHPQILSRQWNLDMVDVQSVWLQQATYGERSTVAVLDSGIAQSALAAFGAVVSGYDFVSDESMSKDGDARDANFYDPGDADPYLCPLFQQEGSWHGTRVASVLAANHSASGFYGVAPAARIQPVRVLGRCKTGFASDVADAIVWVAGGSINGLLDSPTVASQDAANVIVMAFAGVGICPSFMQTAVDLAVSKNIKLFAAAGNDPNLYAAQHFPANCKGVLSVGALTWKKQPAIYSAKLPALYMPGGDPEKGIPCLDASLDEGLCVGTSMAAPHAAGLAALGMQLQSMSSEWDANTFSGTNGNSLFVYGAAMQSVSTTSLSSALSSTCSIIDAGLLKCWGFNSRGFLGLGHTRVIGNEPNEMGNFLPLVDLGTGRTVTQVSLGHNHACAVLDNGRIKCWGNNNLGQLGLGDLVDRGDDPGEMGENLPYVDLGTNRTVKQVSLGVEHTCALLDNNLVKCWGNGNYGRLGYGDTQHRGDGPGEMGESLPYVNLGVSRTVKRLASKNAFHTCAILDNDKLKCWGYNSDGQLGLGHMNSMGDVPAELGDNLPYVSVGTNLTVKSVSLGYLHTCAVLSNDQMKCWGSNSHGRLGIGDSNARGNEANEMGDFLPFVDLGTGMTAQQASPGTDHTCALLGNGMVKCWGRGEFGMQGYAPPSINRGDNTAEMGDNLPFVNLGSGRHATQVHASMDFTCALLDDKSVKCWGNNPWGQLGQGSTVDIYDPGSINPVDLGMFDCVEPTCPNTLLTVSPCSPLTDKAICRGMASVLRDAPSVYISTKRDNTCVIIVGGLVKCWGPGTFGRNGNGMNITIGDGAGEMGNSLPFVDLGKDMTAKQISVAEFHTCVLLGNSNVKCWGRNLNGALGLGDVVDRGDDPGEMGDNLPYVNLGTNRTVKQISANNYASCAVLDNDMLKCWGNGVLGRLGLESVATMGDAAGEMGDNLPYVSLGTNRTVKNVSMGTDHACALLDNNLIKCWGNNNRGQLGYGDVLVRGDGLNEMGDRLPFVNLGTNRTVKQVSAGQAYTCALLDNDLIKCWGWNGNGQLGQENTDSRGDASNEMGDNLIYTNMGIGRTVKYIRAGWLHTCAILDNGGLKCWGRNFESIQTPSLHTNFGDSPNEMGDNRSYIDVGSNRTVLRVQMGYVHTCFITDDGRVKCWGTNNLGQSGQGSTTQIMSTAVASIPPINLGNFDCFVCPSGLSEIEPCTPLNSVANCACTEGQFYSSNDAACQTCPQGSYSNATGWRTFCPECTDCSSGLYQSSICTVDTDTVCEPVGATVCQACPAGTHALAVGSTTCLACSSGTFSASAGSSTCSRCQAGTFSNAALPM